MTNDNVEIRMIETEGKEAWYVSLDGYSDWFDDPVFVNNGSGLEPKSSVIHGPFASEQDATEFVNSTD